MGNYEIAAALGLLTATYHDDNRFGPVAMDYLTATGGDTTQVIRIATSMTGPARHLIAMRQAETGARMMAFQRQGDYRWPVLTGLLQRRLTAP